MPTLTRAVLLALVALFLGGCKHRIAQPECDAMLNHYAELVVRERMPDASAETLAEEQTREKSEARGDDAFKNCTAEVERRDYDCAMRAATPDALEKCLE